MKFKLDNNFLAPKEASKILGVHQRTLHLWEKRGWIETIRSPGIGKRFYNVNKYLAENNIDNMVSNITTTIPSDGSKLKILYIRISKKDLLPVVEPLKKKYSDHYVIIDIGNPTTVDLPGIKLLLKLAIVGRVERLVIPSNNFYFGFDIIESSIKEYSDGIIEYINPIEESTTQDIYQLMEYLTNKLQTLKT